MEQLTFVRTMTVEQFKKEVGVQSIDIVKSPKTGKLFMAWTGGRGAVAKKGIPAHPMISQVVTENGETFYLLHAEGEGAKANVLATF